MRNTIAHPLTDEEIMAWLDKKMEEEMSSGSFGSMAPMIIQTIKHRLGEHKMFVEAAPSAR